MVSVIIPVYNEESIIRETLTTLPLGSNLEVIVVDGGSVDRTKEIAEQFPVRVIKAAKNRAAQMNEGAKQSNGDVLLFLHADCLLENGSLNKIVQALNNGNIGGCLSQRIDSKSLIYRFIEKSGNARAKLFRIFYGDQAIFVRRDIFFKLGGFNEAPLFEDILFSKKIKKEGKVKVLNKNVFVSPRRWEKQGVIKTTVINWLLSLGLFIGVAPHILKKIYDDIR